MNGVEPKPHEISSDHSCWKHLNLDWCNAVEVVDFADEGWGVWFWRIVSSGGITKKSDDKCPLYNWSERIFFPTREEAEHYAQVVYDMRLYD